jgi:predicted exporter
MSGRPEPGPWVDLLRNRFPRNLSADSGRMGIVLTRLIQEPSTFVPNDEPFVALEQIAQRARAAHPEVRIGLTGVPLLERDEMKISQQDMTWATVLSVVGVTLMVWAGFGGLKYPLLGALTLLAGIAWTCGYLTLVIGHLNILSMSFGVILVGLGIDFSVHFVARYLQSAEQTRRTDAALVATLRQSAPPILAGAVTTAAAFLAIALTEFRGVAELGMIASGGIMLCAAATLLLLPCAIRLVDSPVTPTALASLPPMERAMIPCWNRPGWTTIGFASLAALLAGGLGRLEYDHNLLNLQAPELPSVQWERRLLERSDRNAIFAVSMAESIDEVRRRADIFRQLDSVQHVEELASVFPPASPEKQERVRRIHRQLLVLADTPPVLQAVSVPPSPADVQCTVVAHQLWRSLHDLKAISDPEPPALDDVPRSIRHRLVGRTGKHLIRIYARGDIWQPGPLERFVDELEQVDPQVTGDPVQTYYASRQMQSSYLRAASLASLAVVGILMVTLRKPTDVLLAALPMVLGLVQLFGLLGWLEIPLNPANIIVLPLLIGIGIDDGIHVVHDRRHNQGARWPTRAMTIGIILTSLTSTLGFGSLLLARHEGLRSLGRVATLGITCCLLTSLVLLPCLLDLFERASRRASRRSRFVVT